jgi:hypothetical protein
MPCNKMIVKPIIPFISGDYSTAQGNPTIFGIWSVRLEQDCMLKINSGKKVPAVMRRLSRPTSK